MLKSSLGGARLAVFSRALRTFLFLCLLLPSSAYAKKYETGFIDRTITIQAVNFKYQVFVPEDWTPHQKWPVILALHGAGERGDDGLLQTDVGIGTAIRSNRQRHQGNRSHAAMCQKIFGGCCRPWTT